MRVSYIIGFLIIGAVVFSFSLPITVPIIYIYNVVPFGCSSEESMNTTMFAKATLEQAVLTQPNGSVVFASNLEECPKLQLTMGGVPNVMYVDTTTIQSARTKRFSKAGSEIFPTDKENELWLTSALRFFTLEDVMTSLKLQEAIHAEADNLLYTDFSRSLNELRTYKSLTVTPLTGPRRGLTTASVMWVPDRKTLHMLNTFLIDLAEKGGLLWGEYMKWLRTHGGCCRKGGVNPDKDGVGIKPFSISEMSMLTFYRFEDRSRLLFFPIVPLKDKGYFKHRYCEDTNLYKPGGGESGRSINHGLFDPGSWGQNLGGVKKGMRIGFSDYSHVVGQAIRNERCQVEMQCSDRRVALTADVTRWKSVVTDLEALGKVIIMSEEVLQSKLNQKAYKQEQLKKQTASANGTANIAAAAAISFNRSINHSAFNTTGHPGLKISSNNSKTYSERRRHLLSVTHDAYDMMLYDELTIEEADMNNGEIALMHATGCGRGGGAGRGRGGGDDDDSLGEHRRSLLKSRPSTRNAVNIQGARLGTTATTNAVPILLKSSTSTSTSTSLSQSGVGFAVNANNTVRMCISAPYVRCSANDTWTPLNNLHVHSKHTWKFVSSICPCRV